MGVKETDKKGVGNTTLYTLPYCIHCNTLKQALSKLKIPYKEIDVDENEYMGDWIERNYQSNLEKTGSNRIFNTIEEALEILLSYYYEI